MKTLKHSSIGVKIVFVLCIAALVCIAVLLAVFLARIFSQSL